MKQFLPILIAITLLLGGQHPVLAEVPRFVQVRLFEAHPKLTSVNLQGPFEMVYPLRRHFTARQYKISESGGGLQLTAGKAKVIHARKIVLQSPVGKSIPIQAHQLKPRRYPGQLVFQSGTGQILEISNIVPAATYVAIVAGSETFPGWPMEALKAQTVLTQTGLERHGNNAVIGDSTQHEVYLGSDYLSENTRKAVQATWGQRLTFQGQAIVPFYHASCAGHTSSGEFMSDKAPAYLTAVRCPYCGKASFSQPTRTIIQAGKLTGVFRDRWPVVIKKDLSGRPLLLQYGSGGRISGYDFWIRLGQRFGWDKAPGTRFSLAKLPNGNLQMTSTGAGHGLGLCQHGAAKMAKQGKTYREILRFYFPKTQLSN